MGNFLNIISVLFIPIMVTVILLYGIVKKAPIYDQFITGAKDGLHTAMGIAPFIIAIFMAIKVMVSSGAMSFLEKIIGPLFHILGIPKELMSLIILRPVSGSGSLVIVEQLCQLYGADSFIGRTASVMAGSCETVFYVLAIYFGVTAVKNMRHSLSVGMVGYLVGIFSSLLICMYI
ncbi:MAG: nucleoside recognition domain-containing protein [Anaerovorax sp.]